MPRRVESTVLLEGERIIYRNFTGRAGTYNHEGDRNFVVTLPEELARAMDEDGWNVKWRDPRDEGDDPTPTIQVTVSFGKRPPRIVMIGDQTGKKNDLTERNVDLLDGVDIVKADMILNPYNWGPIQGKYGVTAYLKALYVTIEEDPLMLKYGMMDDAPSPEEDLD